MDWTGCKYVERVPGKMGGVPVLVHSRVTPESVVENYEDVDSPEEVADMFDLEIESVRGVLEFAGVLRPAKLSA